MTYPDRRTACRHTATSDGATSSARASIARPRAPAPSGPRLLSTLVGLVIYKAFPDTALWAIGTLVGIQLIFDGWFWVMLGVSLRQLPAGRAP